MKTQLLIRAINRTHNRSRFTHTSLRCLAIVCMAMLVSLATQTGMATAQEADSSDQFDLVGTVAAPDLDVSFIPSKLKNVAVTSPTSLQFGPDDRLYVSQQDGLIKAFTITRNGADDYTATVTETIALIQQIPNHNDDGSLAPSVTTRQVTGILLTGTATNPVLYVSSSDPRITVDDKNPPSASIDTNSGIVSRLRWNGSSWDKLDLVRGLPRSKENHSVNGMTLDENSNTLYLMVGGNTNMGAPSTNFSRLPEFAYSAALLSIDLDAIGESTYDLPTLDDEDRTGNPDANDPFGGNMGKNQAIIDPAGPVQIYAPGWRNAYDIVLHSTGELYTVDNGSNAGWGGVPAAGCLNTLDDSGRDENDILQHIAGPGYYGGHPNPTRGNIANTFNSTTPQSPVTTANATECTYIDSGDEPGALAAYGFSTNGLVEYTASTFSGALQGNLLTATYAGHIWRMQLNANGDALASPKELLLSGFDTHSLDVTAQPDDGIFPGTIWVVTYFNGPIWVFEPDDNSACEGTDNPNLDEDSDGYTNADEIDNETNPCSAGSLPTDNDGDKISDLNDPDDDGDGVLDTVDLFALDRSNGADTALPVILNWDNGDPNPGGILNLGFTGLMSNGNNYATLYDAEQIVPSGAAGIVTLNNVPGGDAYGNTNTQQYGVQFGVNVGAGDPSFTVHTRVPAPFAQRTLEDTMSIGAYVGRGDQDNYLKLVVSANGGAGGVQVVLEEAGTVSLDKSYGPSDGVNIVGAEQVDLMLHVNPSAAKATISIAIDGGTEQWLGSTIALPASWFNANTKPAVGIISTSAGTASFPASWDFLRVTSTPNAGPSEIYLPLINKAASALSSHQRVPGLASIIPDYAHVAGIANMAQSPEEASAPNEAPVANPGSPQVVVDADNSGSEPVQLFGGGSYDPDDEGSITSYSWSNNSGLTIPSTPNPIVDFPVGTHVITLTVTDDADETNSKSVTVDVRETISTPIYYRVNTGGGVTPPSDSSEVTWSGDNFQYKSIYLTGGSDLRTYVTTQTVEIDDESLDLTAITEGMMRSERYLETDGEAGQQMSYDFPLEAGTEVEIRIYLAEIWFQEEDARLFTIAIEGESSPQFTEINQYAQFGYHHAVMLKEVRTVTDGNLDIDFISIVENPAVKAIEIVVPGTISELGNKLYLPLLYR